MSEIDLDADVSAEESSLVEGVLWRGRMTVLSGHDLAGRGLVLDEGSAGERERIDARVR